MQFEKLVEYLRTRHGLSADADEAAAKALGRSLVKSGAMPIDMYRDLCAGQLLPRFEPQTVPTMSSDEIAAAYREANAARERVLRQTREGGKGKPARESTLTEQAPKATMPDVTPNDVRQCFDLAKRVAKSVWELRQVGVYRAKARPNVSTDYVAVRNEFVDVRGTYERVCRAVPDYSARLGHIKAENMLTVVWRLLEEASTVINDALDYPQIAPADQRVANVSARFGRLPDYYLADVVHVLDVEMALTVLLVQLPAEKAEAMLLDTKRQLCRAYERRFPHVDGSVATPTTDTPKQHDIGSQPILQAADPRPFSGGQMVFFADRVELCGVDICSGRRSQTKRTILELLAKKCSDGTFVAYDGKELADQLEVKGTISGAIRDLRDGIAERLLQGANIACGRLDVIESGGTGYRFCKSLTVQLDGDPVAAPITDMGRQEDVRNVRNDDVRNVRDIVSAADSAGADRRAWILERLGLGDRLRAPDVKKRFNCSLKTAERELQSLKKEGRIEFVGAPRTGYYQLVAGTE